MIGVGSAVIAYANSPHEFRGHVTCVAAGQARVAGAAVPSRHVIKECSCKHFC